MRLDLLVNDFVYRAVNDRAVVVFEGHFKRNYIHIRDVAGVFRFALDHFEALRGSIAIVADDADVCFRTARRWVSQYRKFGLVALARKSETTEAREG